MSSSQFISFRSLVGQGACSVRFRADWIGPNPQLLVLSVCVCNRMVEKRSGGSEPICRADCALAGEVCSKAKSSERIEEVQKQEGKWRVSSIKQIG